ncbi:MAG: hypothetical protein N4A49_11465 [Marinifilaceae bacterium]|jgi:hypothetical protein|nr:hypothetical protein [Marinifilaceae bacterium]
MNKFNFEDILKEKATSYKPEPRADLFENIMSNTTCPPKSNFISKIKTSGSKLFSGILGKTFAAIIIITAASAGTIVVNSNKLPKNKEYLDTSQNSYYLSQHEIQHLVSELYSDDYEISINDLNTDDISLDDIIIDDFNRNGYYSEDILNYNISIEDIIIRLNEPTKPDVLQNSDSFQNVANIYKNAQKVIYLKYEKPNFYRAGKKKVKSKKTVFKKINNISNKHLDFSLASKSKKTKSIDKLEKTDCKLDLGVESNFGYLKFNIDDNEVTARSIGLGLASSYRFNDIYSLGAELSISKIDIDDITDIDEKVNRDIKILNFGITNNFRLFKAKSFDINANASIGFSRFMKNKDNIKSQTLDDINKDINNLNKNFYYSKFGIHTNIHLAKKIDFKIGCDLKNSFLSNKSHANKIGINAGIRLKF